MHSNTKLHVSLLVHYSVTAGLSASREFKHPVGIEPETPDSLLLTLINEPWICVSLQKKTVYCLYCFATCDLFSFFRIVVLTLLKLNIKARNKIPEFLNANLCSKHLITSI